MLLLRSIKNPSDAIIEMKIGDHLLFNSSNQNYHSGYSASIKFNSGLELKSKLAKPDRPIGSTPHDVHLPPH